VREDTNGDLTNISTNQNISTSLNDAANVSFIARLRVAGLHLNSATLIIQNERIMKITSHIRMFIVIAMMTATACSEPEVLPITKPPVSPGNQSPNSEIHTAVTTWSRGYSGTFVGIVSAVSNLDLSKATISVVGNGKKTRIDPYFDSSKFTLAIEANEGYIWASFQNNILMLNYVGPTETSVPPFPLDVIIVY
jgi:hypothetical protein